MRHGHWRSIGKRRVDFKAAILATGRARIHPLTAVFAVLVIFASFYLPPYRIDLDHWHPFIAAATAIRNGSWPYLGGYDSGYGFLCPAFLALWLVCFGLSVLSLSSLVMFCNLVAGVASFALIRRLTGSPLLALLGALYPLQGISPQVLGLSRDFAVSSSFRAPVQIALCALLLYLSLHRARGRFIPAFLFGVMVLWDPLFGAFAAAGFVLAHGYLFVHGTAAARGRGAHARAILAMVAGIVLPLALIAALHGAPVANPAETYGEISATSRLAVLGYANAPQQFDPIVIVGALVGVVYLALVVRRASVHRALTPAYLFVGATLIAAIPRVLYALGRSDPTHYLPLYWALMPCAAFFIGLSIRVYARRGSARPTVHGIPVRMERARSAAWLIGLLGCAYFWGSFPLDRILSVKNFADRYELALQSGRECFADGCKKDDKISLHGMLQRAREPLQKTVLAGLDPVPFAACRDGIPVLSYADAWIYATAGCYSPLRIPSVSMLVTESRFEQAVRALASERHVLLDPARSRYADWQGDPLLEIRSRLLAHGFTEAAGCGRFSVLSKVDPAPVLRRLCG
jgi:hypothetical protein